MERGTTSGTGTTALAIAALLHVAILAIGPLVSARLAPPPASAAIAGDTFDIDVTPPPSPKEAAPAAPSDDDHDDEPSSARAQAAEEPADHAGAKSIAIDKAPPVERANANEDAPKVAEPAPAKIAERADPTLAPAAPNAQRNDAEPRNAQGNGDGARNGTNPPPASEYGPPSPAPVVGVPGLGAPVWAIPGVLAPPPLPTAAPTVAPPAKPVDRDVATQVLTGGAAKKDKAIGLDLPAAGLVASTVAAAVRSNAPQDAKATIEVKLEANGKVQSVRVVKSNGGDGAAWDRAAKAAAAQLGQKALAMTGEAAAHGATVTVKVESKTVLPAGTKDKVDVQPVCAEEVLQQMAEALADPAAAAAGHGPFKDPASNRVAFGGPGEDGAKRKFCIPIGVAAKGDASNLGAHAQTQVTTSFSVKVPHTIQTEDVKEIDLRAPWSQADPNKVKLPRDWGKKKKKKPQTK